MEQQQQLGRPTTVEYQTNCTVITQRTQRLVLDVINNNRASTTVIRRSSRRHPLYVYNIQYYDIDQYPALRTLVHLRHQVNSTQLKSQNV